MSVVTTTPDGLPSMIGFARPPVSRLEGRWNRKSLAVQDAEHEVVGHDAGWFDIVIAARQQHGGASVPSCGRRRVVAASAKPRYVASTANSTVSVHVQAFRWNSVFYHLFRSGSRGSSLQGSSLRVGVGMGSQPSAPLERASPSCSGAMPQSARIRSGSAAGPERPATAGRRPETRCRGRWIRPSSPRRPAVAGCGCSAASGDRPGAGQSRRTARPLVAGPLLNEVASRSRAHPTGPCPAATSARRPRRSRAWRAVLRRTAAPHTRPPRIDRQRTVGVVVAPPSGRSRRDRHPTTRRRASAQTTSSGCRRPRGVDDLAPP